MKNLSLNDPTQLEIIRKLEITERLLVTVLSKLSGKEEKIEITLLPDLGLPHNITRIRGGFYTGMHVKWDSNIPFIPVDATINSCGVAIYELGHTIDSKEEFERMIEKGRIYVESKGYKWNFNEGNHFIIYGLIEGNKPCMIFHSSAKEYKIQNEKNLYPSRNAWYYNNIKTFEDKLTNRYLRYIEGKTAEKFYEIARQAHEFNIKRQQDIANIILGDNCRNEVINLQHYGMPSEKEVAIGCSWNTRKYVLLTAPNKPIFIVRCNEKSIVPHGFGVASNKNVPKIEYIEGAVNIDGEIYKDGKINKKNIQIRNQTLDNKMVYNIAKQISKKCDGELISKVVPIYSYCSNK